MNPRTILTLADGRNVDLQHPKAADFEFLGFAAEHLAKENRYNGATPGVCYSVAQHTVECVNSAMDATGDHTLAAYLSLHDFHEALLKDDTTPKKHALASIAEEKFGVLAPTIMAVFDELTSRHDAAIHEAAGLAWPPAPGMKAAIKYWDKVLLVTEWRDLMKPHPLPNAQAYADVEPLSRRIIPNFKWQTSEMLLGTCWRSYLPVFGATHAT